MKALPQLHDEPINLSCCCSSLSSRLITNLGSLLPHSRALTLSVGSGSGVLEALLTKEYPDLHIIGVEVDVGVNDFLPPEKFCTVSWTGAVHGLVEHAEALLFVYPRDWTLVRRYLAAVHGLLVAVFVLPQADLDVLTGLISAAGGLQETILGAGLRSWEVMIVFRTTILEHTD